MLGDVALHEHRGDVGIEADGEQDRRQLDGALADDAGFLGDGQGVEVDDAVEHVVLVLPGDPVAQRSEVAAEVGVAGGLDAGQDSGHGSHAAAASRCGPPVCGPRGAYPAMARPRQVGTASGTMATRRAATPVYEGPFDLLLQLILAEEVDIYEVSLARIVDAYLAEIERMQALDLDVATEFLLIAATLVELKARRLLPGAADVDLDDELALWEERDLLLARLLECKTFKDVARCSAALADDDADRVVPRRVGPDERFADARPRPARRL